MSYILLEDQKPQKLSVLQNIHSIMKTKINALQHRNQNYCTYQTSVLILKRKIDCLWRFQEVGSSKDIKVIIRPVLSESLESNVRIQTQRGFVDLLWVINRLNRQTKDLSFTFFVSEYKFIELCTNLKGTKVTNSNFLRKVILKAFRLLPRLILRLIEQISPYLERKDFSIREEDAPISPQPFFTRSFKMLLRSRYKQIQKEDKLNDEEILKKMQLQRKQALSNMKYSLMLMGYLTSSLNKEAKNFHQAFEQWERNRKHEQKARDLKNVFGVKILKETSPKIETDSGEHCKIVVSTLKFVVMMSVNKEINDAFQTMRKNGKPIINEVQKEMKLVKKILKDPKKISSIKSLLNELQFIKYIKEKGSENISTYYLKQNKPKANIQVIMDYYPQNLKEMLHKQGTTLSLKQKLIIFRQIVQGVDWLSRNYVCHRDLKPANIMLDINRTPKIIDFGSCCPVFDKKGLLKVKQKRLLGTEKYFHKFIQRSMGCIYRKDQYEQHLLFDAYSLGKIMRDIFIGGFPNNLPNLQGLCQYMAERCEEENPACRFSYQQMLFLLENFIQYLERL